MAQKAQRIGATHGQFVFLEHLQAFLQRGDEFAGGVVMHGAAQSEELFHARRKNEVEQRIGALVAQQERIFLVDRFADDVRMRGIDVLAEEIVGKNCRHDAFLEGRLMLSLSVCHHSTRMTTTAAATRQEYTNAKASCAIIDEPRLMDTAARSLPVRPAMLQPTSLLLSHPSISLFQLNPIVRNVRCTVFLFPSNGTKTSTCPKPYVFLSASRLTCQLETAKGIRMSTSISRRSFLSGAVLAGVGAAGVTLAGCSPSPTKKSTRHDRRHRCPENGQLPSVEQSQISQTVEVDVAVIGLGIAGVAALRSAAEHGLKVIGIERCATPSSRSCTFAYFNTDRARSMNIADVPPAEIANEIMIQGSHYPNMGILVDFARHCGEAVDWYCDAYNPNMVWTDDFAAIPADENELYAMSCTYYTKSPFLESAYRKGATMKDLLHGRR